MSELYIYSAELDLIGILDIATDVIWTRRYHSAGEFEIHTPISPQTLALLQSGHWITKLQGVDVGVIEVIELTSSDEGEILIARGRFGASLLARRIILEETKLNTTVETAIRTLASACLISPSNPDRIIPNLILGSALGTIETVALQVTYKNLLSTCRELAESSGLGFRVRLDPLLKKLVFDVLKGTDRSAMQTANPQCIFSSDYDTLIAARYTLMTHTTSNVAIVGGEGIGEDRILVNVGSGQGLDRREVFVNAKDQRQDDQTLIEYQGRLAQKGALALSDPLESFEGEVIADGNLQYGVDYDLGDIVTIAHPTWNKAIHVRITEITEVWDADGFRVIPTFGKTRSSSVSSTDTSDGPSSTADTLTPNRVVVTDAQGEKDVSSVTTTELQMLAGVQSAIQSQINAIWQRIYPVGSLYLSTVVTDPSTLFGGSWQRIEDRFLLAGGTTYAPGSTGGNANHAHTSAAHTHDIAGHSHTSAAHTHSVNAHSHSSAAHTHTLVSHNHTLAAGFAMLRSSTGYLYLRQATSTSWIDNQKISGTVSTSSITQGSAVDLGGQTDDTTLTTNSTTPGSTGTTALTTNSTTPANTGTTDLTTDSTTPVNTGSSEHLPPYLAVYVFKRIA